MCGISVLVQIAPPSEQQNPYILRRGPDHHSCHQVSIPNSDRCITFASSVLHLRGPDLYPQPVLFPSSNSVLCWNGQVYRDSSAQGDLQNHLYSLNDTELLSNRIIKLESSISTPVELGTAVRDLFESMEAEFAFVYYHEPSHTLFFGRDWFGRRSLLISVDAGRLTISSVDHASSEIIPNGIYYINLTCSSFVDGLQCIAWSNTMTNVNNDLAHIPPPPANRQSLPMEIPTTLQCEIQQLYNLLSDSVRVRVLAHAPLLECGTRAPVAILFSGGLDCSVIAAFVHIHLPPGTPIELINVAFANPRSLSAARAAKDPYSVPDRATAITRLAELRHVFPDRDWRLSLCDVPYSDVENARSHVMKLMRPAATVMDFSIAVAFWFASRHSHARILLSGLGADEQLAGYSRHRGAFENCSDEAHAWGILVDQVQLDVSRIAVRNLGRDDRIISDNGREVRFPFLDTQVVLFLNRLPISSKCDMRYVKGVGDKLLLRLLAKHKLGLNGAAVEEKRAIQFGARSAKLELGSGRVTGDQLIA